MKNYIVTVTRHGYLGQVIPSSYRVHAESKVHAALAVVREQQLAPDEGYRLSVSEEPTMYNWTELGIENAKDPGQ